MANTVAEHYSAVAFEMRHEIREMLGAGQSEQEILDHYVAKYGDLVLAAPAAHGFNLIPYLVPFLLLLVGSGSLVVIVRRWATSPTRESRRPKLAAIDPEQAEHLRRVLHEFDA
jgi:cytochrome c-type biogenesis protein CcmH